MINKSSKELPPTQQTRKNQTPTDLRTHRKMGSNLAEGGALENSVVQQNPQRQRARALETGAQRVAAESIAGMKVGWTGEIDRSDQGECNG